MYFMFLHVPYKVYKSGRNLDFLLFCFQIIYFLEAGLMYFNILYNARNKMTDFVRMLIITVCYRLSEIRLLTLNLTDIINFSMSFIYLSFKMVYLINILIL